MPRVAMREPRGNVACNGQRLQAPDACAVAGRRRRARALSVRRLDDLGKRLLEILRNIDRFKKSNTAARCKR